MGSKSFERDYRSFGKEESATYKESVQVLDKEQQNARKRPEHLTESSKPLERGAGEQGAKRSNGTRTLGDQQTAPNGPESLRKGSQSSKR